MYLMECVCRGPLDQAGWGNPYVRPRPAAAPLSRPAQVTGRAADCRVDGALFGRWHKPAGFRCKRTTYADDDLTDHEDDSDDSDAGEVGGSAAVG